MHVIDERLAQWAAHASRPQLRAGPTVVDLGGFDAVLNAADHLAQGPFLHHLIQATAHHLDEFGTEACGPLYDAVLHGLRTSSNHAAFSSATDALASRPALARELGTPLNRTLLARLQQAQDADDDLSAALIGVEAADCLVQLTLAGIIKSAARLLGAMDEATEDPTALPEAMATRLPRLLGVLDAHHPGAGLREALERCLMLDHTCRDAAFELALGDLRQALEQDQYAPMAEQLRKTQDRLAELIALDPDRLDAQLYHAAIEAVLGLSAPDAPARVHTAASTLRDTLALYRDYRHRTRTPAWARPRQNDVIAWSELTIVLDGAAAHLAHDDPWYEGGHGILTALLRAYTAHNTVAVLTDTSAAAAVETLVAPVIEDAFLQHEHRQRFLQHALAHDEQLRDDPAAQQLRTALLHRTKTDENSTDQQAGDPGKARRWQRLAHQLKDDFASLVDQMPDHVLDRLELGLRTHDDALAAIRDPKYARLIAQLLGRLESSRDWIPGIADEFTALLEATIRFAYQCYGIGRQMGGSYTEYLRRRDKDGKKQKVDEALFHQHYREVLAFSALFGIVNAEVIDKGGGRADIVVSFGAVQFNVECKIEEDDASEAGLRQYVAQAAEYQNVNAAFAILLALDKTVGAEGAANLFDSIWIEPVQRTGEHEPCHVVIVRVPGARDNPNLLRPAPRK
ncbi:hypothetical protein [Streptomyces europaeiscabiei]|uniref:hypothetical protein n=1 Tax=Streptomyces europaeiscabiei TaxID=146819 RepID=UPI0007661A6E|nr:hypothetical protein [Streptomyces europaeiscabiei]MDX2762589.1 hypothetical protein [Streptomyces europaeiscabiei]MDX3867568.1 hypothetical protein [Streptomyces europaeiscabiei]